MKRISFITLVAIFLGLGLPLVAFASTISFVSSKDPVHVGDTIVIQAELDTEGEVINVLDGEFSFSDLKFFSISEISVADSLLTLWPNKPSVDVSRSAISFAGGVPKGIQGSHIPLFKIIVEPKKPGNLTLSSKKISQYLNDGMGTVQNVTVIPVTITSTANTGQLVVNEWTHVVKDDKEPPKKFSIEIGRDASVYDNRYFISFSATDNESGIDYYEVQEDSFPKVRSGSPYVLQNQNPKEKITVTAYDNAGNIRIAYLNQKFPYYKIAAVFFALFCGLHARRYYKKKKKNENK